MGQWNTCFSIISCISFAEYMKPIDSVIDDVNTNIAEWTQKNGIRRKYDDNFNSWMDWLFGNLMGSLDFSVNLWVSLDRNYIKYRYYHKFCHYSIHSTHSRKTWTIIWKMGKEGYVWKALIWIWNWIYCSILFINAWTINLRLAYVKFEAAGSFSWIDCLFHFKWSINLENAGICSNWRQ